MRLGSLGLRGLVHYRVRYLLVLLACAVSSAVLCGALVVGDSVRASLRATAERRLGRARFALESADRYVTAELAGALSARLATEVAPLLDLRGTVSSGALSVNGVAIVGVDARFWSLLAGPEDGDPPRPGEALLSTALADRLDLSSGGEVLLRFPKPLAMPAALSLTPMDSTTVSARLVARRPGGGSRATRFSLRSGQAPPLLALVALEELSGLAGIPGRANGLLVADGTAPLRTEAVAEALRASLRLPDLGMRLEPTDAPGVWTLASERVYLDEPVVRAAEAASLAAGGSLAAFANRVELGGRVSSYAFIAASAALDQRLGLRAGEVSLSSWMAEELGARPGDRVQVAYFAPDAEGALVERSVSLVAAGTFPTPAAFVTSALVPPFPGFEDAGSCREWRPGVPIDLARIGDRDEEYWRRFGMTPKAVVSLETARELWRSRYGSLTGLTIGGPGATVGGIERRLLDGLDPGTLGLVFRDVGDEAAAASSGSVDFGELFLALSAFIVASSTLLTGMLFGVSLVEREREIGTLLSLGFTEPRVRLALLVEGLGIGAAGSVLGAAAGVGYAALLLEGLRTVWRGAVGPLDLFLAVRLRTLGIGAAVGLTATLLAVFGASRIVRREPADLLRRAWMMRAPRHARGALLAICGGSLGGLAAVAALGSRGALPLVASFAAAGTLTLALLVGCVGLLFVALTSRRGGGVPSPASAGLRSVGLRLQRNLLAMLCMAAGVFSVVAVGLNRVGIGDPLQRGSGTGGFGLVVETSAPVPSRLLRGSEAIVPSREGFPDPVVAMEVRDGDDASCLNLSRVERPRLLGVSPEVLALRQAFAFSALEPGLPGEDPWLVLEAELPDGEIPAVVDATVLTWGLRKSLGDTLSYVDDFGATVRVRLVGSLRSSVFQGSLLVSSRAFREHFPGSAGYRFLLVDSSPAVPDRAAQIGRLLRPYGARVEGAAQRLAGFTTVQNTYLSVFLLLGGVGVLLGSLCLGLVVARNLWESRSELALLQAVGFGQRSVLGMVMAEQLPVLIAGVLAGVAAAVVAVYPVLSANLRGGSLLPVLALCARVFAAGAGSVLVAFLRATRFEPASALRAD